MGKKNATIDAHVSNTIWTPPERGWTKINSDGAFSKDDNRAGIRVVLLDGSGILIDGIAKNVQGNYVLMVESLALKRGVQLAIENKVEKAIFETDSSELYLLSLM
ncbi:hypothetical protein CCACVL1_05429 [Corchorus capsularis]|uniref:RNase H type-1 domain-containing protein n=1 Tax=Corchorus capsularis TaxID=210143 RepID=A0A1R3JKF3_COCAP|nr:hypothetical protein CCACVL1_05429 [Corchorus capsularis]